MHRSPNETGACAEHLSVVWWRICFETGTHGLLDTDTRTRAGMNGEWCPASCNVYTVPSKYIDWLLLPMVFFPYGTTEAAQRQELLRGRLEHAGIRTPEITLHTCRYILFAASIIVRAPRDRLGTLTCLPPSFVRCGVYLDFAPVRSTTALERHPPRATAAVVGVLSRTREPSWCAQGQSATDDRRFPPILFPV